MVENGDPMTGHTFSTFWVVFMAKSAIFGTIYGKKWHFCPWAALETSNGWIKVDQGWIKVGDTRADVLEPFFPSDIAIGGLQKGLK